MAKKKHQPKQRHTPQRSCIVCREKTDKRQLLRIVRSDEQTAVADPTGKQNGRGAYVCKKPACWDKLLTSSILANALKIDVTAEQKAALATHRPITAKTAV